jgi:UDP-N-acetylglucosamine:LPS N-acetylglucosamine transferase
VAGGGFTLMSEAVFLRKPMLSVPVERQFEQVLNALYLQELGYGTHARRLDEATLGAFLGRIPEHAHALAGYGQDGNALALATLKKQLGLVAARRTRRSRRRSDPGRARR